MTRLPSGVQPRTRSIPGWYVSRFGSPPAVGHDVDVGVAGDRAVNAICEPSGEKCGSVSSEASQ